MPDFIGKYGEAADPPPGIDPIQGANGYARLQAILASDLRKAGMSISAIAKVFKTPRTSMERIIDCVPEHVATRGLDAKYMRRLSSVVAKKPTSFEELADLMMAEAGTRQDERKILDLLGERRKSMATCLGAERRRKDDDAESTD